MEARQKQDVCPKRTADTMSMAIAMSSPSGTMSRRAATAATKRLAAALFGTPEEQAARRTEISKRPPSVGQCIQSLQNRATQLRGLADRGMAVQKYTKEAKRLEREIRALVE